VCGGRGAGPRREQEDNWNDLELQNENAGPSGLEIGVITKGERRRKSKTIFFHKMFVYLFYMVSN
jgi:hypothetical protein